MIYGIIIFYLFHAILINFILVDKMWTKIINTCHTC